MASAVDWVMNESDSSGTDRLVLLAIAYCQDQGVETVPVGTVQARAGLSLRTVQISIARLVGTVARVQGGGRGEQTRVWLETTQIMQGLGVNPAPYAGFTQNSVVNHAGHAGFPERESAPSPPPSLPPAPPLSSPPISPKERDQRDRCVSERAGVTPSHTRAHARFSPKNPLLTDDLRGEAVERLDADEAAVLALLPKWATKRKAAGRDAADWFEDFIGFGMSYLDIERARASPNGRASPGGAGRIAANLADLTEQAKEQGSDFGHLFRRDGGADDELPPGTVEGAQRALPAGPRRRER